MGRLILCLSFACSCFWSCMTKWVSRIATSMVHVLPKQQPRGDCVGHREPRHAGADRVPWWELVPLASHAHPSVAAMARQLLAGAPVVYNGDPLRDLALGHFLDAFVQRKPKVRASSPQAAWPISPAVLMRAASTVLGAQGNGTHGGGERCLS